MRAWRRAQRSDYECLELVAHTLLADIPVHDVWQLDLPGGGRGRTLSDVRSLMTPERLQAIHPAVRLLFSVRSFAGRLFGWDEARPDADSRSFLYRVADGDRARSLVEPGTRDGPFTVLYVHPFEALSEVRNATVHAFSSLALSDTPNGYRLFWAIHVLPVGRITPIYMAVIDPFRRWLVYPTILRHVRREWIGRFDS